MDWLPMDKSLIVHAASLLYIAGFLVKDQLILRSLILSGTFLYLVYYVVVDPPLWEAFGWTTIMGLANLYIMGQLILDRTTFNLSKDELELYRVFHNMTPGEYRKLIKACTWQRGSEQSQLTQEHEAVDQLYYVLDGPLSIDKQGEQFEIQNGTFIGEVAFFLQTPASATVTVSDDARFVKWDGEALQQLQQKEPGIRAALHSILNKDMAAKVARSMGGSAIA